MKISVLMLMSLRKTLQILSILAHIARLKVARFHKGYFNLTYGMQSQVRDMTGKSSVQT